MIGRAGTERDPDHKKASAEYAQGAPESESISIEQKDVQLQELSLLRGGVRGADVGAVWWCCGGGSRRWLSAEMMQVCQRTRSGECISRIGLEANKPQLRAGSSSTL